MHEAKVDIVTVPGLSEHLSNAATTAQLSARFSYAAAMKSINTLLLLGDGETWSRQSIDFAGLPEMVRTFLQVAAGAADIPVTRLLGQSPAGLSATGDSDTRNYYDMIAARQELDLRPQLERLDALLLRSAGMDPGTVRFAFRPLWQLSASETASVALQKAQTTAVYAGLNLWPAAVTAALVQAQLLEDGTYPNAAVAIGAGEAQAAAPSPEARRATADFDLDQPRDPQGRWNGSGAGRGAPSSAVAVAEPSPQMEAPSRGSETKPDQPATKEDQALRTAVNLAVLPVAVRSTVLSLLQTVANLFKTKPAEPTNEAEQAEPTYPPAEQVPSDQDPYEGKTIPLDRSNLEGKIKEYILKPEHPDNLGKAKFFENNLGFNASNWRQFADQIRFEKNEATFDAERSRNVYGDVHYDQDLKLIGTNGKTMTLKGKFAVTEGVARLITILPD